MKKLSRGYLIAIEGIDGSGKSTLAKHLFDHFSSFIPTILTKEPGGTALGKQLRSLLQYQPIPISPKAEYLLYAADRAQHFSQVIIPALAQNTLIISDRLNISSSAYQGHGRNLDISLIETINAWAMEGKKADLIFYIKVDAQSALKRICDRNEALTKLEQEKLDFFERVVQGFDAILQPNNNIIILDGHESAERIAQESIEICEQKFKKDNIVL